VHHCCICMVHGGQVRLVSRQAAPASMVTMRSKLGVSGRPWPASSGLCNVMLGFASELSILPQSRKYHVSALLSNDMGKHIHKVAHGAWVLQQPMPS
jgi:hypothetical protein